MGSRGAKAKPLDEHGKQEHAGVLWVPSELVKHILGKRPKYVNEGWAVMVSNSADRKGHCVLQCQKCEKEYSVSNPSQSIPGLRCSTQQP